MNKNMNGPHSGYDSNTRLLMVDGSSRAISQISAGDFLMGVTGEPVKVTNCARLDKEYRLVIELRLAWKNEPLVVTPDQPLLVRNNFQPIVTFDDKEENRAENYRVYYFDGHKVALKRLYINPVNRVYGFALEAQKAAEHFSDNIVRNPTGQNRYDATYNRFI